MDTENNVNDTTTNKPNNYGNNENNENGSTDVQTTEMSNEALDKYIGEKVAKKTATLKDENVALKKAIEQMKKEKMTDDQIKEHERKEYEKELAEREKAIKARENKSFALEQINELGLGKGGVAALELADLIIADTDEEMTKRAKTLDSLVKALVKEQVDETFKKHGRNPSGGEAGAGNAQPENSLAKKLGEQAAKRNELSKKVLDYYK